MRIYSQNELDYVSLPYDIYTLYLKNVQHGNKYYDPEVKKTVQVIAIDTANTRFYVMGEYPDQKTAMKAMTQLENADMNAERMFRFPSVDELN